MLRSNRQTNKQTDSKILSTPTVTDKVSELIRRQHACKSRMVSISVTTAVLRLVQTIQFIVVDNIVYRLLHATSLSITGLMTKWLTDRAGCNPLCCSRGLRCTSLCSDVFIFLLINVFVINFYFVRHQRLKRQGSSRGQRVGTPFILLKSY